MAAPWRRLLLSAVLLAAGLATGCNILSLPFFVFGPEDMVAPEIKRLASDDKKKEVKVAILAYMSLETRPEFLKFDRDVTNGLAHALTERFKANQENVKVISVSKVEKFKQDHPNWQALDLHEVGKSLGADYVIYLEIASDTLSLYEKGSSNQLYRAHADLTVSLVDVHETEDPPLQKDMTFQYPGDATGVLDANDRNWTLFKQMFVKHLSERLSWCFSAHLRDDGFRCE